jgi:hypothetical protein
MEGYSASVHLSNDAKPPKTCTVCSCPIQWRRWRAVDWDKVNYCSASCRRIAVATTRTARERRVERHAYLASAAPPAARDKVE